MSVSIVSETREHDANHQRRLYEMRYRQTNLDKYRGWSQKHYDKAKAEICLRKALIRYSNGKRLRPSTMAKLVGAGYVREEDVHSTQMNVTC
jgi:hypothetical protein